MKDLFIEVNDCDLLGLPTSKNHTNVKYANEHLYFSFCKRRETISAHFSCAKKSLRKVKNAINDFCVWVFSKFDWCQCVLAIINKNKRSVINIVKKCGFNYFYNDKEAIVFYRGR